MPIISENLKNKIPILIGVLIALNITIFGIIYFSFKENKDLRIYFLDVGQGDSGLVVLPGGIKILIDGGLPNGKLMEELSKIMPPTDRYIDLIILSHPQLDHFGGLIDVLSRYKVGAFITNGRKGTAQAFSDLEKTLVKNNIRVELLSKGDKISHRDSFIDIVSPDGGLLKSKELNDTCLVALLTSNNSKTLFTGDIGTNVEEKILREKILPNIDILKVGHHGSKYSSASSFIAALDPEISVIEVGKKNNYGHPTELALSRLKKAGSEILRTDLDGTIEIIINGENIKVFKG